MVVQLNPRLRMFSQYKVQISLHLSKLNALKIRETAQGQICEDKKATNMKRPFLTSGQPQIQPLTLFALTQIQMEWENKQYPIHILFFLV